MQRTQQPSLIACAPDYIACRRSKTSTNMAPRDTSALRPRATPNDARPTSHKAHQMTASKPPASAQFPARGDTRAIEHGDQFQPKFDADGLIPAIVSHATSGEVLMFAFMNAEALAATLRTGTAHFWSRSRGRLWIKGEESGNLLSVNEIRTDCDQDVVWLRVNVAGAGVACHTGERTCFYRVIAQPAATTGGPETADRAADDGHWRLARVAAGEAR